MSAIPSPDAIPLRFDRAQRLLRIGFIVDVVGYSQRSARLRDSAQRRVSELTEAVLHHLAVDVGEVDRQGTGDGVLAFLPEERDVAGTTSSLLAAWRDFLRADNELYADRIRLRMAVTIGLVVPGPLGFSGSPAIALSRMVGSDVLRDASDNADLVVLLSDALHTFVVDAADPGCTRHSVEVKGFRADVWLWSG
jgi:class 3 adenylate cyclase